MTTDATKIDHYTFNRVALLWSPQWFDMFRNGLWCSGTEPVNGIDPTFDSYHPYSCNVCKRCSLTNTKLFKCTKCRVMLYCSRDHQKIDWKAHKKWCNVFSECRDVVPRPTDMDSWRFCSKRLQQLMSQGMKIRLHSSTIQYAFMQPRCRICFAATSDGDVELITCPRCCGVALCKACYKKGGKDDNLFHSMDKNPRNMCDEHLLNLCCIGMVVEQGVPLAVPSRTDCDETFVPLDWHGYFDKKRTDFSNSIPIFMMNLAPVVAFITDALSTPLTIQHALHELTVNYGVKMVVHVVGASVNDQFALSRYVELVRLNPRLEELTIVMIGPDPVVLDDQPFLDSAKAPVRASCKMLFISRNGVYHDVAPSLEPPSIIICTQAGIHDAPYTSSWRPTFEYLVRERPAVPCIITGYTHDEVVEDTAIVREWGMHVQLTPTPNPFRGLRPFADPLRENGDFHYINTSFAVVRGSQ